MVESFSSLRRVRVGLGGRRPGHLSEEVLVEAISNFGAICVSDRPEAFVNYNGYGANEKGKGTYHIVATTPRNPANRKDAAICMASSGSFSAPIAVLQAQREASKALGIG